MDSLTKWAGTALTPRDISLDLAKLQNVDVLLSTRARLQPWYQPHFVSIGLNYDGIGTAPHGQTLRATYAVPGNRIARITAESVMVMRATAPTTAGRMYCGVYTNVAGWSPMVDENTATVGLSKLALVGQAMILSAGQTISIYTADSSVGGTYDYEISVHIMEFDV